MSALSAANAVAQTDKLTAFFLALLGTSGSGLGLGTSGANGTGLPASTGGAFQKVKDLQTLIIGINDPIQIASLMGPSNTLLTNVDALQATNQIAQGYISALDILARAAALVGVTDLNSYLSYYNTGSGGPWNCLCAPDFVNLYFACKSAFPSAPNAYFEVLQGAAWQGTTFTNALGKFIVSGAGAGAFTAGFAIDSTHFAGGFGQLNVSGLTGSGVVTVTGNWRNPDGTTQTATNGTATIAGNGVTVLTPPSANALLYAVTNIAIAAGITAGTLYVEAKRPSGRTNPPT